ncbi:MAG TPA: chorismate lyase [Gammaproteobacteria bacterium]|nr:chorismate lyase [Gammaproteobacteria bacterium]HAB45790.1 chorismate lyase [Gammaproteobacteria bacterium]
MSKHLDGNDALEANRSSILEIIDWQPAHGGILVQMPENLGPWLIDNGSLTRKLVALSKDQFEVQVLRQEVATPGAAEANALKMTQQTPVMIREVVLKGRGRPWVFARSILPMTTMTGRLAGLRTLSNQPLGELLFQDPSMTREPLEAACLPARILSVPAALAAGDEPLWARRSVFFLDQKPLLVSEVFLSEFKPEV